VYVGKTIAAWDCVLRLVERNLHHPKTLVALTRFATHWQELGAQKQKSAFKTDDSVMAVSNKLEQWNCFTPVWTREKGI
jgi:anti-sigma factor ChrR (cupin superfamily)